VKNQTYLSLGTDRAKFVFVCQGIVPRWKIRRIALNIIKFVGMTPARRGRIDAYPYEPCIYKRITNWFVGWKSGGGGRGYSGFFPLVESWLLWDDYQDVADIGETEITISTCKPERLDPVAVCALLSKEIGPTDYLGSIGKGGPG
jgi:hypothetical protein